MPVFFGNSKGFSLVSVMMAAGVGGIIMVAMSQMIISQQESVSKLEDRLSRMSMQGRLTSEFANPQTCLNNFANRRVLETREINRLYDIENDAVFERDKVGKGSFFVYDQLFVKGISLERIGASLAANDEGRMRLLVDVARRRAKDIENQVSMKHIELEFRVQVDGDRRITGCSLVSNGRNVSSVGSDSCVVSGYKKNSSGDYVGYQQIIADGETMMVHGASPHTGRGSCQAGSSTSYLLDREISCSESLSTIETSVRSQPEVVLGVNHWFENCSGLD